MGSTNSITVSKDEIRINENIEYTTSIYQFSNIFGKGIIEEYGYIEQELDLDSVKKVAQFIKDEYKDSMDHIIDNIFIFKGNTYLDYKIQYMNNECGYIAIHSDKLYNLHFAVFDLLNINYELAKKYGKQWNNLNEHFYVGEKYYEYNLKEGFLTKKSMKNIFCDMREIFFEIMTLNKKKLGIVYDEIIKNKISYLVTILTRINKDFGNILFEKIKDGTNILASVA
jgi:hypothetical protein